MRLCIDARPMQNAHRTRGVGVLLANLLREMGRLAVEDRVTLIVQNGEPIPELFRLEERLPTYRLMRPNRFNWIADQLLLPNLVRRSGADCFLATDFNSYLRPQPGRAVISLVYDLIPFVFPETMAAQPLPVRVGWRMNFNKLKQSTACIAISAATRDDLVRTFGVPAERIKVIHPGIDHTLFNLDNAADHNRQRQLLATLGINGRFLLYVGDSEPRKNLKRVLEALVGISADVKLVLAGKRAPTDSRLQSWIQELHLEDRVLTPGFVADADLPLLYGAATAFIFPTLYEGFGFPLVEAMACGCPVVTSNLSSMPEVAGGAGLLVDPLSVDEIRNAIRQLTVDRELRQNLTAAGLRRAADFSWTRSATETLDFLRGVGSV
ncbi:MAG TPA: glycosyltransferase family 1 protein [Geobacteraceae bacterium]|nr:glycosyltransferase family 1 protein [Geobacteraceae bacterium]